MYPETPGHKADKEWERLLSKATADVDDQGRPVFQIRRGESLVQVGASAGNVLDGSAPPELVRQLLEARLQAELRKGSTQGVSESEVARDWQLLQQSILQTTIDTSSHLTARSTQRPEAVRGNRP